MRNAAAAAARAAIVRLTCASRTAATAAADNKDFDHAFSRHGQRSTVCEYARDLFITNRNRVVAAGKREVVGIVECVTKRIADNHNTATALRTTATAAAQAIGSRI